MIISSLSISAQYEIGHQSFSYLDANRGNRDVWGEVYYPADVAGDNVALASGEFPLIVFGHGFSILYSEYSVWWEELVADGYIVALPRTEGGIFPFPSHQEFGEDLAFLPDAFMADNTNTNSDFYQHLSGKNAILGHSMGGGCSYLAVGNYGANVETIIAMAPANTNPSAITASANITIPVLTIAGSKDCVVMAGEAPIDIYNGLTSTSYKAYVDITDASHCQFGIASGGSICTLGESCSGFLPLADQHSQMFLNAHPWLDYYLKDECPRWQDFKNNLYNSAAHTYMESGALPVPTVSVSSSATSICSGNSTALNANISGDYCSIEWMLDGNLIPNQNMPTLTADQAGTYTAIVYNADNISAASNTIVLTLGSNPTTAISGTSSFCTGSSTLLNADSGYSSYSWSTGASTQDVTIATSGIVSVTVTDANGCTGTASLMITENVNPTATIIGDDNFCSGSNTMLDADSGYSSYSWSDGSTNQMIIVDSANDYTVTVTDGNGCTGTASMTIVESPTPIINITENSGVLTGVVSGGAAFTYQWYLDNNPISNANADIYDANMTGSGTYAVEVTNELGCSNLSSPIDVIISSIFENEAEYGIRLFPTLANDIINVSLQNAEMIESEITIMDIAGKQIFQSSEILFPNIQKRINIADLPEGIYIINVRANKGMISRKFIKI